MTPALDAVSAGDLAWWTGERARAESHWRDALRLADDGPQGLAAEVMARVRLLRRDGNLGPLWHEGPLTEAMAACPATEPWCRIAEADSLLFLPRFAGGDPSRVAEVLDGSPLIGPASARRVLAGAPGAALEGTLDGMGEGIRTAGRTAEDPGTWTAALGVGGAVGAGVGLVARFTHPDLGGRAHRLDTQMAVASRGSGYLSAALTTHTPLPVQVSGLVARSVADRYTNDGFTTDAWWTERVTLGVAPGFGASSLQVGGAARWDDGQMNAGPYARLTLGGDTRVQLAAEAGTGDYDHLGLRADVRLHLGGADTVFVTHGLWSAVPTPDTPWYRLPQAGGEDLLRGVAAGRFRGSTLLGAQAELRQRVVGPLYAAAFFDLAALEGTHWTAGGGLRLVLPPERDNITRVDVGAGPDGWGLVVAWGEAF